MRVTGILVAAMCVWLAWASPAPAQVLAPPFDDAYRLLDLGAPPDVPANLGGLTLKQGTTDRLLIGGFANAAGGALYEIGVIRDSEGHITGFEGTAARFADADNIDGGVAYGPGGTLFLSRYPLTQLGQTRPGSATTDKIIDLRQHGVSESLGALAFVPAGFPGAGSLKLASYIGGQWYDAEVVPDGIGTFDLAGVTPIDGAVLSGPEGIAYVNPGSAEFAAPSVLVSEYSSNRVSVFEVDAAGDPIVATRRDFVTGLTGAEGAFVDPVTGDFLFSTYGGGNRVVVVRGFARAATLSVVTAVVNDDGGGLSPEAFTVHVRRDGQDVAGSPQQGSASGTPYTLTADVEHVVQAEPVPRYTITYAGDCTADGRVTPAEGVERRCVVTADDDKPTASVTVQTQVDGGAWEPQDFIVHVRDDGADVPGSPQPGSEAGSPVPLFAGRYVVAQDAARGYATTVGGDCAGDGSIELADGQHRTCIVTNRAVPLGAGAVIETYGPGRTDGDYGLAEPNLDETRGYLLDPSNFGPQGMVGRPIVVAPGVRVANERTLGGVDVFFTGWTPTGSYSAEEKTALRDFVLDGGTLIATTDDTDHTMVDAFGLTQGGGTGNPTSNTITASGHPIADGPFGAVTAFNQYFNTGHYPVLGPAHEVGRNVFGTSLAVIERGVLGPGSGAAIFVSDVDVFSNSAFAGAAVNAAMIKNLFAFAIGEEGRPALAIGDAAAAEGTGLTFTVRLSRAATQVVRVHYATADDTATAPSDYTAASGDLEFAPGETAKAVTIGVSADGAVEADERFTVSLSGAAGARLADSVGVGTILNDDAPVVSSSSQELPPPEAGEEVNALPKSGTVRVKVRGSNRFVDLDEASQIPVGSVVDTTKGRVTIVAAGDQRADFYDGIFRLSQGKGAEPLTTLTLVEKLSCPKGGKAIAAAKKKRRLWGDGSGKFRTKGKHSAATVVGTRWLVEDRCRSTLTKVTRGKVRVRDFGKRKNVLVRAGKQYVARG